MEIENVMFNSKNRPYCIKCGNEIRKLVHAYTVHEKRGNLYFMRCGCCGATMLGRDNGYYDKNRKKIILIKFIKIGKADEIERKTGR